MLEPEWLNESAARVRKLVSSNMGRQGATYSVPLHHEIRLAVAVAVSWCAANRIGTPFEDSRHVNLEPESQPLRAVNESFGTATRQGGSAGSIEANVSETVAVNIAERRCPRGIPSPEAVPCDLLERLRRRAVFRARPAKTVERGALREGQSRFAAMPACRTGAARRRGSASSSW